MIISKYEKKLMSIIMIAVIVLSGFIWAPKADAADTAKPEVTVLGATLRLGENDNKGSQSMRIGIKIANADKAKDCAIKLELNGKSYTVATCDTALNGENGKVHSNIHSKDETNNSVIYAIVLTNIPKTSFYDPITITGRAVSNDGSETITESTVAQRNVMGIVNSLQKKYPDLGIKVNDNGTLVKETGDALTNEDLEGYNTNDPEEYETVKLEPDKIYDHVTKDEQGNIIIDETGEDIIHFPINPVTVGDTVIVHITGTIGDNSAGLRVYPDAGDDRCMTESQKKITNKGPFDETIEYVIYDVGGPSNGGDKKEDCDTATTICIKGPTWGVNAKDITITSLSVTYKGGNPAPTAIPVYDIVDSDPFNDETAKITIWWPEHWEDTCTITNKGANFTPKFTYDSSTKVYSCTNVYKNAGATFNLGSEYNSADYKELQIRYSNAAWVSKGARVYFKCNGEWVQYVDYNKYDFIQGDGKIENKDICLNWGHIFNEQSDMSDANGYIVVVFNDDGTISTNDGNKKIDTITDIKLVWPNVGASFINVNQTNKTAEACGSSFGIKFDFIERQAITLDDNP